MPPHILQGMYMYNVHYTVYMYNHYVDDDEIWFIMHRYKVMTLVSARKINNTNKIQQPQ